MNLIPIRRSARDLSLSPNRPYGLSMLENLMTVKEVAALLRVSPQTLYKMLEQGVLPGVKVGSQWRFDRNQIREWLNGQSAGGNGSTQKPQGATG